MINAEQLTGKWNEIKGQLKEKWGKLTDNDLQFANGNVDQLIGHIEKRTGEAREDIERFLNESMKEGNRIFRETKETVQNAASQVKDSVRKGYQSTVDTVQDGYDTVAEKLEECDEQFDDFVQRRPKQSLLIALGVGVAAGAGLAMIIANRSRSCDSKRTAEGYARQIVDSLAGMLPDSISSRMRS